MSTSRELHARMIGVKPGGTPWRILVVDDEIIIRNVMVRLLKSVGFNIVGEAANGIEAVRLYNSENPELVTMDVVMPKMDGLTALKQILKLDEKAKVIMLTNETEKELVTSILKAGAKDYIVKPIERKLVMEKLVKVIMEEK
jgi:two-component system chemotaxis response regulator CheY